MEFTIATEAQERSFTDSRGIVWRFLVRPAFGDELTRAARTVGLKTMADLDPLSPDALEVDHRIVVSCLDHFVSVTAPDGSEVSVNGKPATDPDVKLLILRAHFALALAIATEAAALGSMVGVERGNS